MGDSESIQPYNEKNANQGAKTIPNAFNTAKDRLNLVKDASNTAKDSDVQEKTKKSLRYSVYDGAAASVMEGAGNNYIAPFGIAMNANNTEIGLLTSMPNLIAPLFQVKATNLMERFSRKKIVLMAVLFHAILWIPILAIPFFFIDQGPILLVIFFTTFAIAGSFAGPAWTSWMGDLVPEDDRGKYFGRRNRIAGFVALTSTLIASRFLDYFKENNKVFIGFAVLFFIAMLFRLLSRYYLSKKYEPGFIVDKSKYFSFWEFSKKIRDNNFGRFVIYLALMQFAANIAGPFFAVYMLKNLNLSYMQFTIINIASTIATLLTMPFWGKLADKYGNINILRITGLLIAFVPINWLFSSNWIFLVIANIFAGFAWAGFNLCTGNFIYDSTTRERRALCVSYYNIYIGIGVFIGATIGGLIATFASIKFMHIFLFIFLLSGIARLVVSLIFLPKLEEKRLKQPKKLRVWELIDTSHMAGTMHNVRSFSLRLYRKGRKEP